MLGRYQHYTANGRRIMLPFMPNTGNSAHSGARTPVIWEVIVIALAMVQAKGNGATNATYLAAPAR